MLPVVSDYTDARSRQPEMTLRYIARKRQKSAGNDRSTLTLKLMGRVIPSPKQRVPVAPQNGPRSHKNFKKKITVRLQPGKMVNK